MALSLRAAAAFVADYRNPYERDEDLIAWQRDLLAPFGLRFEERLLAGGPNIGFSELAEQTLKAMPVPVSKPDMVIVTYGLSDWCPFMTIGAYLDYLLGGGSVNFGISDQGLRAPFTALRIAESYARSGRCASLVLLVLDQTTFGYQVPHAPQLDSGVLLLLGSGGDWGVSDVRGTPPGGDVADLLRDIASDDLLVVAGPNVAPLRGLRWHRAEPGSYCTTVWRELAEHSEEWARRYRVIVLCDTDPRTGRGDLAVLRNTSGKEAGQ